MIAHKLLEGRDSSARTIRKWKSAGVADELTGWSVEIVRLDVDAYRLRAKHESGATFEMTGTDPETLREHLSNYAVRVVAHDSGLWKH